MKAVVAGVPVHWREAGHGDLVLFVHGFPFHGGMWQAQLDALPSGWRGVAPDLRGFAETPVGAFRGTYGMDLLADDLAGLIEALGAERAVVCGLSMGGYVALALWRRHPQVVRALVLSDTRAGADTEEARERRGTDAARARREGVAWLVEGMLPKLLSERTRREQPETVAALRQVMEAVTPETVALALEAMADRPDSAPLLAGIDVPALLVAGAEDAITPPAELEAMAAALPDARLVIIDGAGHVPPLERPDAFSAALTAFLGELQGGSSHPAP